MIVLAREVFLCKCSTEVGAPSADGDLERNVRFVRGSEDHLGLLDPVHHDAEHACDFRARLARGETWLLGVAGGQVATYTWLHTRSSCEYPYLPGCAFRLGPAYGYGYDAWTPPERRGAGLRRQAFVEELRWLGAMGKRWEASFFVAHQLEGAKQSLVRAGIAVVPVWRIALGPGRRATFERLTEDDGEVTPRDE
jgi:hypothetical protein